MRREYRWLGLTLLICTQAPCNLTAQPREVLLIRHAEKLDDEGDIHLSPAGVKRANALPKLFQKPDDRPNPLPKPNFIFATKKSKHSNRPVETVTPLAQALKLEIDHRFEDDEFPKLADELLSKDKYEGTVILICWHHGNIPYLAKKLKATDVPDKWKDSVFDKVWVLKYGREGTATLTKRHQGLLPGDEKD